MTSEEAPWKMRLTWPGPQPTLQLPQVWWLPHNSCQSSEITPEGPLASFLQSVLFSSAHYSGHATLPSHQFPLFQVLNQLKKKNYSRYMRLLGWVTSASCHISVPPLSSSFPLWSTPWTSPPSTPNRPTPCSMLCLRKCNRPPGWKSSKIRG